MIRRTTSITLAGAILGVVFLIAAPVRAQDDGTDESPTEDTTPVTEEVVAEPVAEPAPPPPKPAPAPPVATAPVIHEDVGAVHLWDRDIGLLFSFNNVFTIGNILSQSRFGVGGLYGLSDELVVRGGLTASRNSNPADVVRTTTKTGNDTVVDFNVNAGGPTSTWAWTVGADALLRLTDKPVAPYVGGGAFLTWSSNKTEYKDDLSIVDQSREVSNHARRFSGGLLGVAGIGWRIHESFSIYAEYNLRVSIWDWQDSKQQTTIKDSSGGSTTSSQTKVEFEETRYFNYATSLGQGGSLGLIAFF